MQTRPRDRGARPPAPRRQPLLFLLPFLLVLASCTSESPGSSEPPSTQSKEAAREPKPPTDPLFRPPVWEETKYGLHMDLTYDANAAGRLQAIERAASVNAQISRSSFMWHKMQPTRDGGIDWSVPDSVVNELLERGIEPMFAAYGSPSWANGTPESVEDYHLYVPQDEAAFDQWVAQYAHFMRAAAARYRGKVTKWEVWNEQNETFFWKPEPNVDRYIEFFQKVRAAILDGNPDAQVSIGGLAALAASGNGISGIDFLEQMLEKGIRPAYISVHPYTSEGQGPREHNPRQNNFGDVALIHDLLERMGHEVPIWVTEWGWRSDEVGLETQAQYLQTSLEMIANEYPYVTVATYFLDYDRTEFTHGLFTASGNPKPAAEVFANFVAQRSQ